MEQQTIIFTDGSSRGNPGPGGFGAIVIAPKNNEVGSKPARLNDSSRPGGNYEVREIGGREGRTTNNRMELQAAISALSLIHNSKFIIRVYTDSAYVLNGITRWVHGWQKNNWKTIAKKDVENRDLWEKLLEITGKSEIGNKKIEWKLVGGHVGVAGNMRCDEIATAFADGLTPKLYSGILKNYGIEDILDINEDTVLAEKKESGKSRSNAKAYSYVSLVDGIVQTHKTWAECEARVKGRPAKYKKVFSPAEEAGLIDEWGNK